MKTALTILVSLLSISALALSEVSDSIKTQELKEAVVQADRVYMTVNIRGF